MHKLKRSFKKYPIVFMFFIFLFGFSILDELWPKRVYSEMENRDLAQYPKITLNGIATNQWMVNFEKYVKEQFAFRDTWIDVKSVAEMALLKTENNDILFGKDNYLFTKEMALSSERQYKNNLDALVKFAQRNPNTLEVMVVPSSSLILEDKVPNNAPLLNENFYLDSIFSTLNDAGVKTYDVRSTLSQHNEEYIYYRTDHHWTSYGAYLAYEQFALDNNLAPFDVNSANAVDVNDFYGTHYSKARNINVVPDVMTYYDLPNTLTIYKTDISGNIISQDAGTIYDKAKFETRDKYAAYLRGNNGYSVLNGNGEGKILVVKDSYANSFIPYLVENYAEIGIVDYRDNVQKLDSIMQTYGYDKVLFLYSFDSFTSDSNFAAKIVSG